MPSAIQIVIALINWAVVIFFCVKAYKAASAKERDPKRAVLATILLAFFGAFVCAMIFIVFGLDPSVSTYFSPVFIALGSFAGFKLAGRGR